MSLDGLSDVAVGATGFRSGTSVDRGAVWFTPGEAPFTDTTVVAEGGAQFTFVGFSVSSAGDVNGDGYGDLMVGTPPGGPSPPQANLYLGAPSFPRIGAAIPLPAGLLAYAGDVNGDGYADLLISGTDGVGVYLGGPAGPAATASVTLPAGASPHVLASGDVDGDGYSDVFVGTSVYYGSATGLGSAVALPGSVGAVTDTNGDGYADLIVGGTAGFSVYAGGPTGIAAVPVTVSLPAGVVAFTGVVASAGDVNLDGYSDLAIVGRVSATVYNVYVYLGNADSVDATPNATLPAGNGTSSFVTASAGDFNGDGYADVAVAVTSGVSFYPGGADGVSSSSFFTFATGSAGAPTSFFGAVY